MKANTYFNVGSYNIANGKYCDHDISLLGDDIKSKNLDVVGLQEVDMFVPRSKSIDTMKLISESSGLKYYKYFKAIDLHGGEYGIAILSKYPILDSEKFDLDSKEYEHRVCGRCLIDLEGFSFNFFVTHLAFELSSLRQEQFNQLLSIVKNYKNVIITGDFNVDSLSEFSTLENADFNCVNNKNYYVNTFDQKICIDNIIYHKDSFDFSKPSVLENHHSDHSMLYAKAEILR